ncbi:hypothetical protein OAX34_04260, partial [Gammaproteobacteria bacterium]|nr:hypothetical protein [Gammaproteobacteria bacterium]
MINRFLSITLCILFIVSCGGGGGGGSTPTPPTTPTPTVNLSAEPISVVLESTSTLTWSSTNATSCSATWTTQTGSSGSEAVSITTAGNNSFSISCTGDGGTRSASVTVEGYRETDGVVVDGYISGAEVCIDEDESWTCDSNENSTTSDNEGKFTIRYANGNLVSIGGTDLDSQTLLDNFLITQKLTGHSEFKAVTPVTSIAAFMEDASLVNAALGIDSSIDVFIFDPVANKGDGGINDYLYEKGNQLTVLAYALQNITNNINTTTETTQDYFRAITEEIEKEYTETETKVDIETEAFITKTLDNVIAAKSATIDETAKTNTTKALASVLPVIQVKENDDTTTALIRFAVSTLQTDIQAIANGTATAETVTSYTSDIYNYIATDQDIDVSEIIPEETNQEPTITNLLQVYNSDENQTYAFQVEASDPEGDTIYYSLSGVDKEFFDINVTGLIKFKEAPDYENPLDSGKDNTYKINIDVSDSLTSSTNSNLNTQTSNSFSSDGNPDIKPSSNSLESNNSVNATEVHITNIDEDLIDLVFNTTDGTSSAAPTISIDMQIDELTKASEVQVLTWLKDSAQTWYYATKNDSLNWSINETLNKYASAGTYEIRKVLIKRNDLDDLTIVDTALKEKGFDIDAVITNSNSDSINPELKGVDSITVSGNDGDAETNIIVTIVISVEDNESGVEKAFSYIKGPGGEIAGSWGTLNEEKNKVTFTFTLDPRTGSGTYTIDDIRITDNAGNEKIYTNSEIRELSFTDSWSVTNQIADKQAPNIIALSLTSSLNASDLNRKQITIDITTDDQVTDINDIYIRLISPDNANIDQYIVDTGRLFTTTKNGNKYSHTISLPLEYPDGAYTISYIFINDKALNNKQYSAAELSELGFDTSVVFGQI